MTRIRLEIGVLAVAAVAILHAGCGSSGSAVPNLGPVQGTSHPSPNSLPNSTPRMYLSIGSNPGTISGFQLPIVAATTSPVVTVAGNGGPGGMAFDPAHRLFVANNRDNVQAFTQPIRNGAAAAFTLGMGSDSCVTYFGRRFCDSVVDVAVDRAGDLFAAGNRPYIICPQVRCPELKFAPMLTEFTAPVRRSSSPFLWCCNSGEGTIVGLAFDSNGDLWLAEGSELDELAPPSAGGRLLLMVMASAVGGIAFDAFGNMYVVAIDGVDVYNPPFLTSMTKAFTMNAPRADRLAFDSAGKLYVTCGDSMLIFAPPFSSASQPIVTFPFPGALGVAIGP